LLDLVQESSRQRFNAVSDFHQTPLRCLYQIGAQAPLHSSGAGACPYFTSIPAPPTQQQQSLLHLRRSTKKMGSLPEPRAEMIFRSTLPDIAIPDHLPLHDYVFEHLPARRDRPCLIDGATGETLTFGDVDRLSRRVAAGMRAALGVRKGGTVMLLLPNSVEFAVAFLACSRLGAAATTANPLHTPAEIAKQAATSGATVVFTEPAFVDKVRHRRRPRGLRLLRRPRRDRRRFGTD
jgi:non-ribosomal peptide synthetase component F